MSDDESTRIYFVRHGDIWNPNRIFYGRLPRFRLSPLGMAQVAETTSRLANVPVAALYSSPLLRARQTARAIGSAHPSLQVRISKLLLEIRSSRQGESHDTLDADGWNFYEPAPCPGDETIAEIAARVTRFCQRVVASHRGGAVVAVTHGDVVATAFALFSGRPLVLASLRGPSYPGTGGYVSIEVRPNLAAGAIEMWTPQLTEEDRGSSPMTSRQHHRRRG